ncbi:dentin sialophosphoprotein [Plutella xylostella]|uniref:dentin sialophosphoprotein n=1 Tax=Plutella xylostella TaxID=51655 RepID=UPI002032E44A|nr:dentin sialophosphoprotein [Plutella xylostella]
MKAALFLCLVIGIISEHVSAKPTQPVAEPHHHKRTNCLLLTPEKERQIELVVQRLTEFLNQLTAEMDLIDLRVINLEVDEHDHEDSSETVLQLTVNDCVRKEFDPEEFYGTDSTETKDKTGNVTQKPVEAYTDRPDVAESTNTQDQNEPSNSEIKEPTTLTPVESTEEVVIITEVPVTTTMQTVADAIPVTTAVTEIDTTTTEPLVTTTYSVTTEKNDNKDEIVTSDTSTADVIANFERPREMNNVYVDYIDYENDIPISSSEENSYNEIEETPDSNDETTEPTGYFTDQNTNQTDEEPPISYNKRAVTGNDEEIINDTPNTDSYEYEDIPDSTESSSEYKDSSELPEDSNDDDVPQTPTTDNYSIINTPVVDDKNNTDIDNGTGDKENNTINQTTTSTTELPNIQPVTTHPDDGPTTDVSQFNDNPTSTSSTGNKDTDTASSENDENYNDDYDLESSEYDDIEDSTELNDDADETGTEDQVQKSGSEVEESTTSTIPQENIATTETDQDNSNVTPEIVYLNLANNGWAFIDDIRKQKGINAPPIVILQDTPKANPMPNANKQMSDVTATTSVSKSKTSVSKTETKTATSDRSPSKLYYLHLPGAGQQYLKERSKAKGDSPTLVYVESVQPNQTTYVFVD